MSSGRVVAVLAGFRRSALAFLCAPAAVFAQAAALEPVRLAVDQVASATQRSEEPVTYLFKARAGASYLIDVEQRGLDFIVTVESPEGRAQSYNSPLKRDEHEYALLDAAGDGDYRITVVSNELTSAVGEHSIKISALAAITRGDAERERAWRSMTAAAGVNAAADRERLSPTVVQEQADALSKSSLDAFAQCRYLWQKLEEHRLHAQALYSMAMLEYGLYNWSSAADLAALAADAYREIDNDLRTRALVLHASASLVVAGELEGAAAGVIFERAIDTLTEAAAVYEPRGTLHELAEVQNLVGYAHHLQGDLSEAKRSWEQSASLFARIGDWREELNVRQNLAVVAADEGYLGEAIDTFGYIARQIPSGKDPELEANVLENLGAVNRDFGNIDEALRAYSRALALRQKQGDGAHVSASLRGLGSTYYVAGEYERAKTFLQRALDAARDVGDGRSEAAVLTYLGNIAFLEADYDAALMLHRDAERITNSAQGRAVRRLLIAKDLAASGRHAEALSAAEEVARSSGDLPLVLADAQTQIGRNLVASGEYAAATDHLQQALSLYRSLRLQEGEADALNGLALAAFGGGAVGDAIAYGGAALDRIENLRVKVSAPELRALYSAAQRGFYETQIDLLMSYAKEGTNEESLLAALSVSERARARMLVDLLATARVDAADAVDEALATRKNRMQDDLAARSRQRDRLLASPLADASADAELDKLLREITALENELTLLDTQALAGAAPPSTLLSGAEIQKLVGPGTVLLQYELGERRSFVWVVMHDSIRAVELAPRDTIETAARDALTVLQTRMSEPARRNAALRTLADKVLTPVGSLSEAKRVLVAADGALHYVPFSVLPVLQDDTRVPLITTREIISVPSMSALAAQRARRSADAPGKVLAVYADPVFERTDQRLTEPEAIALDQTRDELATRASNELRRLPHSGREARGIAALVPENARFVSEGFSATRDGVLSADLKQYRYVHFATHGVVDSRYPALSALALSQFDRKGNAVSGFLRLDDIYNLHLNADLVVLSACDTALGRAIRGEGLVGLTQAFLYAGTKSLVLSLWQVSDAATAVLMTRFYEQVLKEGTPPAEALRAAQLSMAEEARWADPYYWGAFILLGDVAEN